uniref:Uncharacterized protein n=1 Tax=Romanomermis culicivorax TaxID=13658 RepID=A0A915K542_ROMCU
MMKSIILKVNNDVDECDNNIFAEAQVQVIRFVASETDTQADEPYIGVLQQLKIREITVSM